ncbi:HPP family-domain-containing protein [Xylaria intraflava]|nr:HPP family-domain-containing protein [Xylaria intraflava]
MAPLWQQNFDIDDYLNRIIPSPPWSSIPYPVSYLLGHRQQPYEGKLGNLLLTARALLGVFISLILIQLISHQIPWVATDGLVIVGSFGAAAVLEFYTFESPLAQPRSFVIGQIIGTVIGVLFRKLFQWHPNDEWVRWSAAALACATTTAVMGLTKTVYPPAGATALLAVIDDTTARLGWRLLPLVLLGCVIMLFAALILNNIFSKFPLYWWTANSPTTLPVDKPSASSLSDGVARATQQAEILIIRGEVFVPVHVSLSPEERLLLEKISNRL